MERRRLHVSLVSQALHPVFCTLQPRCSVVLSVVFPTSSRWQLSLIEYVCVRAVVKAVNGLAEELRLQVQPLQDVLGHAQDRIDWLYLLVTEQGESCHSEQSVEGIHLRNESRRNTQFHRPF